MAEVGKPRRVTLTEPGKDHEQVKKEVFNSSQAVVEVEVEVEVEVKERRTSNKPSSGECSRKRVLAGTHPKHRLAPVVS